MVAATPTSKKLYAELAKEMEGVARVRYVEEKGNIAGGIGGGKAAT